MSPNYQCMDRIGRKKNLIFIMVIHSNRNQHLAEEFLGREMVSQKQNPSTTLVPRRQSETKGQPAMTDCDKSTTVIARTITNSRRRSMFCTHKIGATKTQLREGAGSRSPTSWKSKPDLRGSCCVTIWNMTAVTSTRYKTAHQKTHLLQDHNHQPHRVPSATEYQVPAEGAPFLHFGGPHQTLVCTCYYTISNTDLVI